MSLLLLCLSLTFLQSFASLAAEMLVKCNETESIFAGETVTLNCSMNLEGCKGVRYHWSSTRGDVPCDSGLEYKCEWDRLTYVSLTTSNITGEENFTIRIQTDCGVTKPLTVKVQEPVYTNSTRTTDGNPERALTVFPAVLAIFIFLFVLGILFFLFGTDKGRKMMKCTREKKTRGDNSDKDIALWTEELLVI